MKFWATSKNVKDMTAWAVLGKMAPKLHKMVGEALGSSTVDMIYCCGPTPMLRTVKQIAEFRKIPCQLSLEQRMGCGIGACLTCVCETKDTGMSKYKQVCSSGPVFDSKEVVL